MEMNLKDSKGREITINFNGEVINNGTITGDIVNPTYYGGEKDEQVNEPQMDINDYSIDELREIVDNVLPMIGNTYSYFFSVIKVMMWKGRIPDHDFEKGVALVNELYPEWELGKQEQYALAKYDVQSFYKSFDRWTVDDAPVKGKSYKIYHDIAEELLNLL